MASGPITSWEIDGETVSDFILGAPKLLQMVTAAMKLKDAYSLVEVMNNLDSILKSRDITLQTKVCLFKAMIFQVMPLTNASATTQEIDFLLHLFFVKEKLGSEN